MERAHGDELFEAPQAARRDHDHGDHLEADVASRAAPDAAPGHLPASMGNAAFSRVVGGGLARSATSQGAGPLHPGIAAEIEGARGGGTPLADDVRGDMESGLGVDLSAVRVHTDPTADALNRSVQAEAFTTGTDIFFRAGSYAPGSSDGRRLLAHELTHVVQQSSGQVEGGRVSHPDDAHEVEARAVADEVASAPSTAVPVDRHVDEVEVEEDAGPTVARQALEEEEEEEPADLV